MFSLLYRRRDTAARPRITRLSGPASLETLETRRLFAVVAGGTATIDESTPRLDVEGSRRADVISVDLNSTTGQIDVVINGQAKGSFALAQIPAGIRIDGGRGNDTITVDADITLPVEIRGNKGNDAITGGSGADLVDGGPGRDTCTGGAGDDVVIGGAGNDSLSGGSGRDNVDGGNGNDVADGGDDSDTVAGGNGRDRLTGSGGDDRLLGGSGRDDCDGGDGNDDIDGGRGRDDVRGGNGTDDFNDAPDDGPRRRGRGNDDNVGDRGPGEDEADDNIPVGQVPTVVMDAFRAKYGDVTIREVEREVEDEGILIQIDFFRGGQRIRARFTEAGRFVSEEVK